MSKNLDSEGIVDDPDAVVSCFFYRDADGGDVVKVGTKAAPRHYANPEFEPYVFGASITALMDTMAAKMGQEAAQAFVERLLEHRVESAPTGLPRPGAVVGEG